MVSDYYIGLYRQPRLFYETSAEVTNYGIDFLRPQKFNFDVSPKPIAKCCGCSLWGWSQALPYTSTIVFIGSIPSVSNTCVTNTLFVLLLWLHSQSVDRGEYEDPVARQCRPPIEKDGCGPTDRSHRARAFSFPRCVPLGPNTLTP